MIEPTTEAGKALLEYLLECDPPVPEPDEMPLPNVVAAIEQEAVAAWLNSPAPAVLMADAQLPEAEILRALAALRAKP